METTIQKLEPQTYQGKPNGFKVTLGNGTEGYLQKESDEGLREGDAVIADVKDYVSKKGAHSNLITLKRVQLGATTVQAPIQRPAINVGTGKSKEELKANATMRLAEVVLNAFFNEKLESAQVSINIKEYGRLLWSEIDEIYDGK